MKTQLTKEESAHLINLGVPKEKASNYTYAESHSYRGGVELPPMQVPIFRLTDLLEILPKEIFDEDLYSQNYLVLECTNTGLWHIGYAHEVSYEGYFFLIERFAEELIDALYELCVWTLTQGYLKF